MSLFTIRIKKVIIEECTCCKEDTKPAVSYISNLSVLRGNQILLTIKGKLNVMAFSLKDNQKAAFQLKFVDAKGADTDAASVELTLDPNPGNATVAYDDPSNTVTFVAGTPGVHGIKIVAKDSAGNVLPFADVAAEVTAGDAVSGSVTEPVITAQ